MANELNAMQICEVIFHHFPHLAKYPQFNGSNIFKFNFGPHIVMFDISDKYVYSESLKDRGEMRIFVKEKISESFFKEKSRLELFSYKDLQFPDHPILHILWRWEKEFIRDYYGH